MVEKAGAAAGANDPEVDTGEPVAEVDMEAVAEAKQQALVESAQVRVDKAEKELADAKAYLKELGGKK